ncbi:TetR/AcrR family transcriptional regulator [Paenibacillus macquariensis]|uniref:Transcriptional regulator, TetR family n=1 Tax=Paenibacillus macquariensis TaxID=948756 RepID=A0ABY1K4L2_9BACL|nr:TetR/AcrR family transcriptional regulator [Paenibacillus macquariensis]MEC0089023.1 TetR/AcrR family transcriptional regulator [Paenibacillus macquariensis]OAB31974.1 TetR family transcriptional regulator [Paenibacillus macquariensis subsp. macquariensis]SIR24641.1 transcriptional regulator, TetR family [Paenibacillus macquariensis]
MKDRIINGTIVLIQQKGFTFTLSDVAKQVAISKRTIYEHFTSKDDIVEHIVNRLILEIKEREQSIAEDEQLDVLQKIEQMLVCIPEEFAGLDMRLLSELQNAHYSQWQILDSFLKEEWTIMLELMKQGIEQGVIRNIHLPLFIELYLSAINQIYDPLSNLKDDMTMRDILQSVVDILLYGITTQQHIRG